MMTLIFSLIATISGFITVVSLIAWYQTSTSSRWPSVMGEITDTEVIKKEKVKKDRVKIKYTPVVRYRYNVNGHDYENDRLAVGWKHVIRNEDIAKQITAKYPVGSQQAVYYDPKSPASSTLRSGASGASTGMLLWPGLVFIASLAGLIIV